MKDDKQIAVLSFYSFTNIEDVNSLQPKILYFAKKKYLRGTILIAKEGFNGTISGELENLEFLLEEIKKITHAKQINVKVNYCDNQPFSKIKVKIKKEIVALKYDDLDVEKLKGTYISPKDWDEFISKEDVVAIDTRNDYEIKIGTFKNAVNPKTETFSQLPEWTDQNIEKLKGKKVAMFCTGGIRCEKSTALLRKKGIKDVYHLEGGILQYLEDTKNINNMWQGECFVFDDRGAVSQELTPAAEFWVQRGETAKSMSLKK